MNEIKQVNIYTNIIKCQFCGKEESRTHKVKIATCRNCKVMRNRKVAKERYYKNK